LVGEQCATSTCSRGGVRFLCHVTLSLMRFSPPFVTGKSCICIEAPNKPSFWIPLPVWPSPTRQRSVPAPHYGWVPGRRRLWCHLYGLQWPIGIENGVQVGSRCTSNTCGYLAPCPIQVYNELSTPKSISPLGVCSRMLTPCHLEVRCGDPLSFLIVATVPAPLCSAGILPNPADIRTGLTQVPIVLNSKKSQ